MGKTLRELKEELLAEPRIRRAYEALAPEFELAAELVRARALAGLSQTDVAERMGTTQSAVARLESGRAKPSLTTLQRYAAATGARAVVKLVGTATTMRRR